MSSNAFGSFDEDRNEKGNVSVENEMSKQEDSGAVSSGEKTLRSRRPKAVKEKPSKRGRPKKIRLEAKAEHCESKEKNEKRASSAPENKHATKIRSPKVDKALLAKQASELLSKLDAVEKARAAIQEGLKIRAESNLAMLKTMLGAFEKATEGQFTISPKRLKKSVCRLIGAASAVVPSGAAKRREMFAIDDYLKCAREELYALQDGSLLSDLRLLSAKLEELELKRADILMKVEDRFKARLDISKKTLDEFAAKAVAISDDEAARAEKRLKELVALERKLKLENLTVKKASLRRLDSFMKALSERMEKLEGALQGK